MVMYEGLWKLGGMLAGRVPAPVVDEFVGFLNAGEPDVGLEWLSGYLLDGEIPLSRAEGALISAEGAQMRLTRASVLRIGELLSAD